MTAASVSEASIGDLRDIPYVVVIPILSRIKSLRGMLEAGRAVGPITAARVGGELYPVDKMDILAAHREAGRETVPCTVIDASSLAEAQLIHIRLSDSLPTNPFTVNEAAEYVGGEIGGDVAAAIGSDEYRKIADMPLVPEIRSGMSRYITSLGARMEHVPSFYHVFRAISRLDGRLQVKAMNLIVRYCDRMAKAAKYYAVPEPGTVESILSQFGAGGPRAQPDPGGGAPDGDGSPGRPPADGKPRAQPDPGGGAPDGDGSPGYLHDPDRDSVAFRCECGLDYVFNSKNRAVRKAEEAGGAILLQGDYGEPMYAMRRDAADHLEMGLRGPVHYYMVSGEGRGGAVVISRRRLSGGAVEKISAVIGDG